MNNFVAELDTMDTNDKLFEQAKVMLDRYLADHGLRKTQERYELLRAVCCVEGIFSVEQLIDWLNRNCSLRLSRSTVYGGIDLFVSVGVVLKHAHFKPVGYENSVANKPHICMVCEVCGCVQPLCDPKVEAVIADIRSRRMNIRRRLLYLDGMCKKCEAALRKERAASRARRPVKK